MKFADRGTAGRRLATKLSDSGLKRPIVLAIPRGGTAVAKPIADHLSADFDLILARRFFSPWHKDYALGSVTDAGDVCLSLAARGVSLSQEEVQEAAMKEAQALRHERARLSPRREPLSVAEREVVLVDDDITTGATAISAIRSLQSRGAERIIVAIPVVSRAALDLLKAEGVEVVSLALSDRPVPCQRAYMDAPQLSDEDVLSILLETAASAKAKASKAARAAKAAKATGRAESSSQVSLETRDVKLELIDANLNGTLRIPQGAKGTIVFVQGTSGSRHSPRNQAMARSLGRAGFATLLLDLFDESEAANRWQVFDVDFLAQRLRRATEWLMSQELTRSLPIGYFSSSTGTGVALHTAAAIPEKIAAIVSRGGRPDLASDVLPRVQTPVLLIVGENDHPVIDLNRNAMRELACERNLILVPGAGHSFDEPGTLEEVIRSTKDWFQRFLARSSRMQSLPPFDEPPGPGPVA